MVSHECIKARAEKFGNMRKYRKFRNLGKSGKIGKFGNPQKRRYVPRWTQGGIRMTSVRQAKHQHNVQKWTQIIMEQRASGLSGLAYCRRAEINFGTARATRIRIAGRGSLRFIEVHKGVLSTSAITTASFGDLLWDNTYHGNRRYAAKTFVTDSLYPKGRVLIMLIRELTAEHIYLACGYTEMRKSIDKGLAGLTKEEREEQRLRLEKEKLEAYFAWLQDIEPKVLPKSKLGKAVQYSLSHKEALQAFLKSGNAALSNNICERAIRNFTIGRKNWLFSDSPKGAKASAAVYSIIETANANGLNPFQYLKYLFEHLPNADIQRHPEHLDDVLPWNETIQQNCK